MIRCNSCAKGNHFQRKSKTTYLDCCCFYNITIQKSYFLVTPNAMGIFRVSINLRRYLVHCYDGSKYGLPQFRVFCFMIYTSKLEMQYNTLKNHKFFSRIYGSYICFRYEITSIFVSQILYLKM